MRHRLCHGWAAGPRPFLSERVLGVKFLEPGGRKVAVSPELCGLDFAEGSVPTPFGPVRVAASRSGRPEIDAPEGVEVVAG
ncbi:MAG: hypothetical protein ACI406_05095 [Victivallis vadensis]